MLLLVGALKMSYTARYFLVRTSAVPATHTMLRQSTGSPGLESQHGGMTTAVPTTAVVRGSMTEDTVYTWQSSSRHWVPWYVGALAQHGVACQAGRAGLTPHL